MKPLSAKPLVTVALYAFVAFVALAGCDKSTPAQAEAPNTAAEVAITPLSVATAKNMKYAVIAPLTRSTKLSETQKKCLDEIDEATFGHQADVYYSQHFTQAELDELNDFYSSDTGKVFSEYGLQQILIATGAPTGAPVAEPSAEQLEEIMSLRERPTFKKYEQLNMAVGEDSLMGTLNTSINKEFARCEVDLVI